MKESVLYQFIQWMSSNFSEVVSFAMGKTGSSHSDLTPCKKLIFHWGFALVRDYVIIYDGYDYYCYY